MRERRDTRARPGAPSADRTRRAGSTGPPAGSAGVRAQLARAGHAPQCAGRRAGPRHGQTVRRRRRSPPVRSRGRGPPWCNGSMQAFGALRSRFESGGRSGSRRGPIESPANPVRSRQTGRDRPVTAAPWRPPPCPPHPPRPRCEAVVVLAAGQGTRMRSATPKVLHRVGGRSLLGHALAAAAPLAPGPPRSSSWSATTATRWPRTPRRSCPASSSPTRTRCPGTGRALWCGRAGPGRRPRRRRARPRLTGRVLVTSGDVPLVTTASLERLLGRGPRAPRWA